MKKVYKGSQLNKLDNIPIEVIEKKLNAFIDD